MLLAAIFLLLIAIAFGIIILAALLEQRVVPARAVSIHGGLAAIALLLVIIYMLINGSAPLLVAGITLLLLGALGGLTLVTINKKGKRSPKVLLILHPIVAVTGLIILVIYVLP